MARVLDLMLWATLLRHMVNITIIVVTSNDSLVWARLLKLWAWCGVTLLTQGLEFPLESPTEELDRLMGQLVDWLLLEVTGWLEAKEDVLSG